MQTKERGRRDWLLFQKVVYEHDDGKFATLDYPVNKSFAEYRDAKGFESDLEAAAVRMQYGSNKCVY